MTDPTNSNGVKSMAQYVSEHIQRLEADVSEWKEKHTIVAGSYNLACEENERLNKECESYATESVTAIEDYERVEGERDDTQRWADEVICELEADVSEWKEKHTIVVESYNLACEENKRLREALEKLRLLADGVDNGQCRLCKWGYREYSLDGKRISKCSNEECLSHELEAAALEDSKDV